jgi:hypothetical protein
MPQSKAQIRAQKENVCIYLMSGWKRFINTFMTRILSTHVRLYLVDALDYAIADIKATQQNRNPKLRRK